MTCVICKTGEYILSSEITKKVLEIANEAWKNGIEVEIRKYAA